MKELSGCPECIILIAWARLTGRGRLCVSASAEAVRTSRLTPSNMAAPYSPPPSTDLRSRPCALSICRIRISSIDYDRTVEYGLTDPGIVDSQLALAQGVIDYFRRTHELERSCSGLEIKLHNDAPPGSGTRLFVRYRGCTYRCNGRFT